MFDQSSGPFRLRPRPLVVFPMRQFVALCSLEADSGVAYHRARCTKTSASRERRCDEPSLGSAPSDGTPTRTKQHGGGQPWDGYFTLDTDRRRSAAAVAGRTRGAVASRAIAMRSAPINASTDNLMPRLEAAAMMMSQCSGGMRSRLRQARHVASGVLVSVQKSRTVGQRPMIPAKSRGTDRRGVLIGRSCNLYTQPVKDFPWRCP